KIELGQTKITVGRLFQIADVLDATPEDIIAKDDIGLLSAINSASASA
ncbi:MAG: hypothetical protein JST32_16775, partial [Bacteroidetes bacterium]|nr:hypothetical protein [Bacteroidota bacterium]